MQGSAEPNREPREASRSRGQPRVAKQKRGKNHSKWRSWGERVSSSSLFMGYRKKLKLRPG